MADATIHGAPSSAAGPWQKRLIWTGVMICAAGAAYVTGRLQTSALIDTAEKQAEAAEQKATQRQAEVSQQQQLLLRYEARRRLHLALIALEERNFGIAKDLLSTAAGLLEESKPAPGSELAKLHEAMLKYHLIASEDLSAQRVVIQSWVKRLDPELNLPDKKK